MHPAHVAVSVVCLACGLSVVAAYLDPSYGSLGGLGVFFGYWATLAAIVIGVLVAGVLFERARDGKARAFVRKSWLGLVNGAVALTFRVWVIARGS
jgi:hypothetical protein